MCDLTSGWRATDNKVPFDIGKRIKGDIIILMLEQSLCPSFRNESSGGKASFQLLNNASGFCLGRLLPIVLSLVVASSLPRPSVFVSRTLFNAIDLNRLSLFAKSR